MGKVHITLVGGQAMPVYNGIAAVQPDMVVFVYSKESINVVNAVKNETGIPFDEQEPLHETDPQEIISRAQSLAEKYKDDEITLNITSGLKSWSHLFARVFDQLPNATIIYIDQNNVLWDYKQMNSTQTIDFDMDASFRLQGNPLKHYIPFADFTEEDKQSADTLVAARRYNCGSFNKLTTILTNDWKNKVENQKSGCLSLSETDYVEWEKPDFIRLVLSTKKYGIQEFVLESPNAVHLAFNAGWFEYRIARMLSHWKYAKDIRLNCIFPLQKGGSVKFPKNEIDIIVNTGTKILFVECKTQISQSTDIDKFRTAVKNYGGLGNKALFITDNVMTDLQKEKCKESGIISFSLQDSTTPSNKEQELFRLLDITLFNINTK